MLTLIGAHHDSKENENNILVQILKIADIYSALKENRAYRPAMSNEEAFDILYQKAQNGEFSKSLVDVLKNAIREENKLQDVIVA